MAVRFEVSAVLNGTRRVVRIPDTPNAWSALGVAMATAFGHGATGVAVHGIGRHGVRTSRYLIRTALEAERWVARHV